MTDIERRRAVWLEIGALTLSGVLPSFTAGLLYPGRFPVFWDWKFCIYALVTGLSELSVVLFILWNSGDPLESFGFVKPRVSRDSGLAVTIFLVYGCGVIAPGKAINPSPYYNVPWAWWISMPLSLVLALAAIVLMASLEEVLFRGALITRFEEQFNHKWIAVLASAVLFGLAHSYQGLLGVSMAFAFGLLAGYIFVTCRSLWPTIVGHVLINCLWAFAN